MGEHGVGLDVPHRAAIARFQAAGMSTDAKRLAAAIARVARRDEPTATVIQQEIRELRQQAAGYRDRLRALESERGAASHSRLLQTAHLHHDLLLAVMAELRATERVTGRELPPMARDLERTIAPFLAAYGPAQLRGIDNHPPTPTEKGGTP